jgi:hypothetical protein
MARGGQRVQHTGRSVRQVASAARAELLDVTGEQPVGPLRGGTGLDRAHQLVRLRRASLSTVDSSGAGDDLDRLIEERAGYREPLGDDVSEVRRLPGYQP